MGLDPEDYSWYLDLRRYGSVKHSGFGAGFGRLVCYVTGKFGGLMRRPCLNTFFFCYTLCNVPDSSFLSFAST
jgi:hypothetical protein